MKLAKSLERLGTESAFSVLAEAKKLEAQGKPMIHLGLGQPDFKTPKHVVEAAKKALDDGHHGYVMSNGIPECRQAVTRWIKRRYSVDVDSERILIMPGGKPTMHYAIQCFGVLKSGCPNPKWIIGFPWASNFFASARTVNADSVPNLSKLFASFI